MHRVVKTAVALAAAACGFEGEVIETRRTSVEVTTEDVLDLYTEAGELEIVGEPGRSEVGLVVDVVRTTGFPPGPRDGVGDDLVMELDADGQIVAAEVWLRRTPGRLRTDVRLLVPQALAARVQDTSGDVVIEGVAGVELQDDSGDVEIRDVVGEVVVDDGSGDLTIERAGRVDVSDDSGELVILDVDEVTVQDESGDIRIETVAGDVDIEDTSGDITVRDVAGEVVIRDGSGDILLEDVGSHEIVGDSSGEVRVR